MNIFSKLDDQKIQLGNFRSEKIENGSGLFFSNAVDKNYKILIALMFVSASTFLIIGLFAPVMRLEKTIIKFTVEQDTWSLAGGIYELVTGEHLLIGLIVMLFTVVLPVTKLSLLMTLSFGKFTQSTQHSVLTVLNLTSKWSMLDVFVIAILIVTAKLSSFADATARWGLYVFVLHVLISMLLIKMVRKSKIQLANEKKETIGYRLMKNPKIGWVIIVTALVISAILLISYDVINLRFVDKLKIKSIINDNIATTDEILEVEIIEYSFEGKNANTDLLIQFKVGSEFKDVQAEIYFKKIKSTWYMGNIVSADKEYESLKKMSESMITSMKMDKIGNKSMDLLKRATDAATKVIQEIDEITDEIANEIAK